MCGRPSSCPGERACARSSARLALAAAAVAVPMRSANVESRKMPRGEPLDAPQQNASRMGRCGFPHPPRRAGTALAPPPRSVRVTSGSLSRCLRRAERGWARRSQYRDDKEVAQGQGQEGGHRYLQRLSSSRAWKQRSHLREKVCERGGWVSSSACRSKNAVACGGTHGHTHHAEHSERLPASSSTSASWQRVHSRAPRLPRRRARVRVVLHAGLCTRVMLLPRGCGERASWPK